MLVSMRSRRMPALFTSTCRSPNVSMAVLIIRWAPSQSATSSPLAMASPPAARISSTTSWAGPASAPEPSRVAAQVVHHDLGALGGEQEGVLAADPAPRSGDDRHPSVQCAHVGSSSSCVESTLARMAMRRRPSARTVSPVVDWGDSGAPAHARGERAGRRRERHLSVGQLAAGAGRRPRRSSSTRRSRWWPRAARRSPSTPSSTATATRTTSPATGSSPTPACTSTTRTCPAWRRSTA